MWGAGEGQEIAESLNGLERMFSFSLRLWDSTGQPATSPRSLVTTRSDLYGPPQLCLG